MGLQHAQQRAQLFTLPSKDRSPRDAFLLEGVWARTSAAQLRSWEPRHQRRRIDYELVGDTSCDLLFAALLLHLSSPLSKSGRVRKGANQITSGVSDLDLHLRHFDVDDHVMGGASMRTRACR